jgi:16S rRNA G1207 methylase RsmC
MLIILAVDSDARAVECTQLSAALNEITSIHTLLTSDGVLPEPGTWDLLLGNPPYYSDYRISELFLQAARTGLREGGRIHIVTKLLDWHQARMEQLFSNVQQHVISDYTVFTAIARNSPGSKTRR